MNQKSEVGAPKAEGRKRRNDVIFTAALLVLLILAGLAFYLLRGEGDTVVVEIDGKVFGTYALSEDRTVEIRTGEGGEELNLLVIRDGKAFMESATCPDGICADHKPIRREGESIVCLPHRVVIIVRATTEKNEPDIVV